MEDSITIPSQPLWLSQQRDPHHAYFIRIVAAFTR